MPKYSSLDPVVNCPPGMVVVPYRPYKCPKKQFHDNLKEPIIFSVNQLPGISLADIHAKSGILLDDTEAPLFEGCGTKVTFVINFEGYKDFKRQKYSHVRRDRESIPNNRAKVLRQVAEVLEAFLQDIQNENKNPFFHKGGICLEDLYLLELRHVARASFQPILAVKKEHAIWDTSLMNLLQSGIDDDQNEGMYNWFTAVQPHYVYPNDVVVPELAYVPPHILPFLPPIPVQ